MSGLKMSKVFGDKKYQYNAQYKTKAEAQKIAKKYRKGIYNVKQRETISLNARVVKFLNDNGRTRYAVYSRRKPTQGYNARMDESLGMRRGASSTKKQSLKSRRDEAKGMNKASCKRAYSSVKSMDKRKKAGARGMNKGMDKIKYYSDKQMKSLLKTSKRDWESLALKKGYDVDVRNYKWFKKKR